MMHPVSRWRLLKAARSERRFSRLEALCATSLLLTALVAVFVLTPGVGS